MFEKGVWRVGWRRLREFNIALLGKWCWRLLVERDGWWCKVLVARYGVEDGGLEVGGRSCSSWWREIVRIKDGIDEGGEGWFRRVLDEGWGTGLILIFGVIVGMVIFR